MGAINRVPSGLLSLLDGQNLGDNPSEIAGTIIPQIDLFHFFMASKGLESVTASQNFVAGGFGAYAVITVPPGELWVMESFVVSLTVATAGQANFAPVLFPRTGSTDAITLWTGGSLSTSVIGPTFKQATLPNELFLNPGVQLACLLYDTAAIAAGGTASTTCLFQRLRV